MKSVIVRVGKRLAIYIPKKIAEILGIREGDKLLLTVSDGKLEFERIADPLELALSGDKFAEIPPEYVEEVSLDEQKRKIEDTA